MGDLVRPCGEAGREQHAHVGGTDEAGGAGDQKAHQPSSHLEGAGFRLCARALSMTYRP